MTILVVDDNTLLLSKIVRSLIRKNFQVLSATSLQEARNIISAKPPKVLCLDLNLPDGSGMDLLEEIRAEGQQLPVVIISGDYSESTRRKAEKLGVSGFFSKPFVLQELHKVLQKILQTDQSEPEKEQQVDTSQNRATLLPLLPARLALAKRAYTTRRVDFDRASQLITGNYRPKPGDLVLARVDKRQQHTHLQLTTGRRAMMNVGDEIVVAYGHRYAPDQFESEVPKNLESCHLVAAGGVASSVLSRNKSMKPATIISPIGVLADKQGKPVNMRDFAVNSVSMPQKRPPVTVVLGTSMNAGKTTVAADLIRGMTVQGLRVGAAKVTGTGAGGDVFRMQDSGAQKVYDFTDCGFPSTYKTSLVECIHIMETLVSNLCRGAIDSIVIEVADGILQDETRALLQSPAFQELVDDVVFAAGDAMGAISGVNWLMDQGLNVVGVSGVMTSAPLAMREYAQHCRIPVFGREDLKSGFFADGRLTDKRQKQPGISQERLQA